MGAARTLLVAAALIGALLCVGVIAAGDLRVGLRWVRRRTAMALRPEAVRVALAQAGLDSIPTEAWVGLRTGGALLAGLVAWAWFGLPVLGLVAFVVTYHLAGVALEAKRRGFESRRQQALLEAVRHGIAVMSRAGSATQMLEALAESGPYEARRIFREVVDAGGYRPGGAAFAEVLDRVRDRIADPLFDDLALAVSLHWRRGGKLVPALEALVADWSETLRLQAEAKAMRSGVEASVILLALLPFIFLVTLSLRSRRGRLRARGGLDGARLRRPSKDVGASPREPAPPARGGRMTAALTGALVLSVVGGISIAALYLAWPRRLTAEEWVVHRRALLQVVDATRGQRWRVWLSGRSTSVGFGGLMRSSEPNRLLLNLGSDRTPVTTEAAARRLLWLAGGGAVAGIVAATALTLVEGAYWLAAASPLVGLIAAVALSAGQLASWSYRARRRRAEVARRLPRVLTGARVLLESGAATAEGALAAAVATYADPSADLVREALRVKEVQRLELEAALDEVAVRYSVEDLHRLADSFRIGRRYGTGMAALLADFAQAARSGWHARYRQRITRAPVLMTVPALVFFVMPLLALVMYLVFSPLLGTLSRL